MTRPNIPHSQKARAGVTDQGRTRWLIPLVPLHSELSSSSPRRRVDTSSAAQCGSRRLRLSARCRGSPAGWKRPVADAEHDEDEHEAIICARAMSIVGTVLVIAITGCAVFTLARGENTSPYIALLALGGISYAVASLALRYERSLDRDAPAVARACRVNHLD